MASTLPRTLMLGAALLLAASAGAARERRAPQIAPMPPLQPAVFDETLEVGGEAIDAKKLRSRLTVAVGINGRGPYRFIVDSGADSSVIGLRAARGLALPAGTPVRINTMTESTRVDRVLVDELRLGSSVVRDLELPALRDGNLGADGMIGLDALTEQRLMLDFEKRQISIDDARTPAPRYDGEIVVTARLRRGQLILTQVKAAGLQVEAVVDTGSEITIGNSALRDRLMREHRDKFTTVSITGVTGVETQLQLATIGELQLGPVLLRNVPIAFADLPPFEVFGINRQPALLLGTDLMENFRKVSLDFRARKVRFQLRKCSEGIIIRTSTQGASRISLASGAREACLS